jgi:hypothetical protein
VITLVCEQHCLTRREAWPRIRTNLAQDLPSRPRRYGNDHGIGDDLRAADEGCHPFPAGRMQVCDPRAVSNWPRHAGEFRGQTPHPAITDPKRLTAELEHVREHGWASEVEELIVGEASCGAPIRDRRGIAVGSIAISGPIQRLCERMQLRSELASYVREAARADDLA